MTAQHTATPSVAAGDHPSEGPDVTEASVLATVTSLLSDVIGEEYALGLEIALDTTFGEDLELESIEFVTLADRLTATYGDQVDFVGFLSGKDVDQVISMTVGEVVAFILASLTHAGPRDATGPGHAATRDA
jgi:acyl carrier protein